MTEKAPVGLKLIAKLTGFKVWKVAEVLGKKTMRNLHRVSQEEIELILKTAADIGYVNAGNGNGLGKKIKVVTIADISKKAAVSARTVMAAYDSRSNSISAETRRFVLEIGRELGYKPTA